MNDISITAKQRQELVDLVDDTSKVFVGVDRSDRCIENPAEVLDAILEHLGVSVAPAPEPWTLIPEGRESAAVLRVNGVVGTYWCDRSRNGVFAVDPSPNTMVDLNGFTVTYAAAENITSVEPVQVVPEGARVLGDDEVAVPRELVERAKACANSTASPLIHAFAAVEGGGDQ
ncbi:hypothetical protein D9V41_09145 [Aeromicrobium phragmitis]|uniref:DUF3846 domain-containing protein n=1 Tax=Aeromicrobium phragmitis TaxID=2478914 RepID=A0A3L8PMQ1_9ACTN|nr:hypothetical protein [Aeromicrobium phragmitis]RLV56043.1 hypothetical protein D9V41_09145 [Aeromicrobium phragmitis]